MKFNFAAVNNQLRNVLEIINYVKYIQKDKAFA